jgi:hypothetical protein
MGYLSAACTRRADDVSGDRMVRMSEAARALLPELWRGLPMEQRDILAAMVDDYDADALPSDAERWQFTHADVSWLHTTADTPERRAALAKLTQMANAQSGPAT